MPDFMHGDRFQIVAAGLAGRRDRPREHAVEENIGLEELARRHVDEEACRRQHAVEVRLFEEAERRSPVIVTRKRRGHPAKLVRNRRSGHGLPRRKRTSDGALKCSRADACHASVRHEITDRSLPSERHVPAGYPNAELEVRGRRNGMRGHQRHCQGRRNALPHCAAPARLRTCRSKSASGNGRRAGSPRTSPAGPPAPGSIAGGVTSHPPAPGTMRNTPWPRPST